MKIYKIASMTLAVKDFPYREYPKLENLLNISSEIVTPIYNKLLSLGDRYTDYAKNVFRYDTVTPDGGDEFNLDGVMNIYLAGLRKEQISEFVKIVIEQISNLPGVTAEYLKTDMGDDGNPRVSRVRVTTENVGGDSRPPEVNLSNMNARKIFKDVLGYVDFTEGYKFDAMELKGRCLGKMNNISVPDVPMTDTGNVPGKARMITFNIDEDGIRDRLESIIDMCDWSIKSNYAELTIF